MAQRHLDIVRKKLHYYGERGIIRNLRETGTRGGKTTFKFVWLADHEFTFVYDDRAARIQFKDLFESMPVKSELYAQVKGFVNERSAKTLPSHRRVDPGRGELKALNRSGRVSILFNVKRNQFAYAVTKLFNTVTELWNTVDQQYMWEHFNIPQE